MNLSAGDTKVRRRLSDVLRFPGVNRFIGFFLLLCFFSSFGIQVLNLATRMKWGQKAKTPPSKHQAGIGQAESKTQDLNDSMGAF